jgi:hypothetical protein
LLQGRLIPLMIGKHRSRLTAAAVYPDQVKAPDEPQLAALEAPPAAAETALKDITRDNFFCVCALAHSGHWGN